MDGDRIWGEARDDLVGSGASLGPLVQLEAELRQVIALGGARILDAHVHLGQDADGHSLGAEQLLADMELWGVEGAVCFPANEPGPSGRFTEANDAVLEASSARITPFCRLDPMGEWETELVRAAERGARGLKLHPVGQSFRPESEECVAVVSAATARGWPVLFHAGFGARRLAGPFAALAAAVPEARIILAHGGRGDARALLAEFAGEPRIAFDTSLATVADVAAIPPAQLMFGSDRPYGEHGSALHLVSCAAGVAGWSDDDLSAVLGGNLLQWLDDAG